jgi:hypothetical protein
MTVKIINADREKVIANNYGSIPHLSTSKLTQQADKKIHIGQELILTKKVRDWKDLIIVTEKLDGSNVGVVKKKGHIVPIGRSGYHANSSPFEQHHFFAQYVLDNEKKFAWLPEGWRVCGEWMAQAHGTLYDITDEPIFVAFDIFTCKDRVPYLYFIKLCSKHGIDTVPLVHIGQPISIKNALNILGDGFYGQSANPEGVVYRVERGRKFDFMAKWVRADKEDGKYMQEVIWNTGFNMEDFADLTATNNSRY